MSKICEEWLSGTCSQGDDCDKIHICEYSLEGTCLRVDACPHVHMTPGELVQRLKKQKDSRLINFVFAFLFAILSFVFVHSYIS